MFTYSQTYSMLFGMSRRAASIVLTPEEGSTLERWSRARSIPARLVQRARIVRLEYADHGPGAGLERRLGAPDLEATPPQTSSDENLQAQPGPAVRRETAGCRGTVPESSGKSPGAVRR